MAKLPFLVRKAFDIKTDTFDKGEGKMNTNIEERFKDVIEFDKKRKEVQEARKQAEEAQLKLDKFIMSQMSDRELLENNFVMLRKMGRKF